MFPILGRVLRTGSFRGWQNSSATVDGSKLSNKSNDAPSVYELPYQQGIL